MRRITLTAAIAVVFLISAITYSHAAQYVVGDFETAVQSLGSRTRTLITRVSRKGVNTSRSLRYQAEGDQALRRGDFIQAAENYGRAEEAINVLDSQRISAQKARTRTLREIARARRNGTDIADAEIKNQQGDRALENGDFVDAELYYAEARTALSTTQ